MAVHAVNDVSFDAEEGRLTIITGPSGGGKTVVLNILAGFIKPDSGKLFINNEDASKWGWRRWNSFRQVNISYGPQRNILIPNISVEENIALPLLILGYKKSETLDLVKYFMKRLKIDHLYGRKTYTLSGGEQRRVMVARTLIKNAPIIILDEPTSDLDEDSSKLVIDLIRESVSKNRIIIVSTHDRKLINHGDNIIKIEKGRSIIIK